MTRFDDYKMQKTSEILIFPTKKKQDINKIYFKDPPEISFRNCYCSNEEVEL